MSVITLIGLSSLITLSLSPDEAPMKKQTRTPKPETNAILRSLGWNRIEEIKDQMSLLSKERESLFKVLGQPLAAAEMIDTPKKIHWTQTAKGRELCRRNAKRQQRARRKANGKG